jgi:hypothetical protein
VRYTTDGSTPTAAAAEAPARLRLRETATVRARAFRGEHPVTGTAEATFRRVEPRPALEVGARQPGLAYTYHEGDFVRLPDLDGMTPLKRGVVEGFDYAVRQRPDRFAICYEGFVDVPADGLYTFWVASDDGSVLWIDGERVVDNDGLHGTLEKDGHVALAKGVHAIRLGFFDRSGDDALAVTWSGPGFARGPIPAAALAHAPR